MECRNWTSRSQGISASAETPFSRDRYRRVAAEPNRRATVALGSARQTNAFLVFWEQLARASLGYDWQVARRVIQLSAIETRPSRSLPTPSGACLYRFASIWPGPISSRERRTDLVEERDPGDRFGEFPPRILRGFSKASWQSSNQSRSVNAIGIFRHWQLDGRRNSLARESFAVENHKVIGSKRTRCCFSGDAICRPRIAPDHGTRFVRSAKKLAYPRTVACRREMSERRHRVASGENRWTNNRLVSEVSALSRLNYFSLKSPRERWPIAA